MSGRATGVNLRSLRWSMRSPSHEEQTWMKRAFTRDVSDLSASGEYFLALEMLHFQLDQLLGLHSQSPRRELHGKDILTDASRLTAIRFARQLFDAVRGLSSDVLKTLITTPNDSSVIVEKLVTLLSPPSDSSVTPPCVIVACFLCAVVLDFLSVLTQESCASQGASTMVLEAIHNDETMGVFSQSLLQTILRGVAAASARSIVNGLVQDSGLLDNDNSLNTGEQKETSVSGNVVRSRVRRKFQSRRVENCADTVLTNESSLSVSTVDSGQSRSYQPRELQGWREAFSELQPFVSLGSTPAEAGAWDVASELSFAVSLFESLRMTIVNRMLVVLSDTLFSLTTTSPMTEEEGDDGTPVSLKSDAHILSAEEVLTRRRLIAQFLTDTQSALRYRFKCPDGMLLQNSFLKILWDDLVTTLYSDSSALSLSSSACARLWLTFNIFELAGFRCPHNRMQIAMFSLPSVHSIDSSVKGFSGAMLHIFTRKLLSLVWEEFSRTLMIRQGSSDWMELIYRSPLVARLFPELVVSVKRDSPIPLDSLMNSQDSLTDEGQLTGVIVTVAELSLTSLRCLASVTSRCDCLCVPLVTISTCDEIISLLALFRQWKVLLRYDIDQTELISLMRSWICEASLSILQLLTNLAESAQAMSAANEHKPLNSQSVDPMSVSASWLCFRKVEDSLAQNSYLSTLFPESQSNLLKQFRCDVSPVEFPASERLGEMLCALLIFESDAFLNDLLTSENDLQGSAIDRVMNTTDLVVCSPKRSFGSGIEQIGNLQEAETVPVIEITIAAAIAMTLNALVSGRIDSHRPTDLYKHFSDVASAPLSHRRDFNGNSSFEGEIVDIGIHKEKVSSGTTLEVWLVDHLPRKSWWLAIRALKAFVALQCGGGIVSVETTTAALLAVSTMEIQDRRRTAVASALATLGGDNSASSLSAAASSAISALPAYVPPAVLVNQLYAAVGLPPCVLPPYTPINSIAAAVSLRTSSINISRTQSGSLAGDRAVKTSENQMSTLRITKSFSQTRDISRLQRRTTSLHEENSTWGSDASTGELFSRTSSLHEPERKQNTSSDTASNYSSSMSSSLYTSKVAVPPKGAVSTERKSDSSSMSSSLSASKVVPPKDTERKSYISPSLSHVVNVEDRPSSAIFDTKITSLVKRFESREGSPRLASANCTDKLSSLKRSSPSSEWVTSSIRNTSKMRATCQSTIPSQVIVIDEVVTTMSQEFVDSDPVSGSNWRSRRKKARP